MVTKKKKGMCLDIKNMNNLLTEARIMHLKHENNKMFYSLMSMSNTTNYRTKHRDQGERVECTTGVGDNRQTSWYLEPKLKSLYTQT